MATEILMPQLGESIAEGTITRWLVAVGDTVERDQPILDISTDKVDTTVPSQAAGVILELKYQEGDTVAVDEVIGFIGSEDEANDESRSEASGDDSSDAVEAAGADSREADSGAADSGDADPGDADSGDAESGEDSSASADDGPPSLEMRLKLRSSPVVRKIAAEHGIEIASVTGTGVAGRVTKQDILDHIESGGAAASEAAASEAAADDVADAPAPKADIEAPKVAAPAPSSRPTGDYAVAAYREGERVEVVPMSRIRALTAAHMTYSKATSAHVSTVFEIDMTRIDRLRRKAKSAFLRDNGTKLTYMPFIFKAVASALKRYPMLNAAIDGSNIVYKKDINLGMAVAMDRGLIVPVVKNADRLSLVGLAQHANDLADRARAKGLKPDEVHGGTFTVTNPGVFGSLFGTPIINQPQVAILGIGTIEKRPVVVTDEGGNDALAIRTMAYFAITFDHRLIDGADADRFMAEIKQTLGSDDWKDLDAYR